MFGNTNQPIDVMVQTGHLFEPMPDVIRDDMAFIDRLHFYLPGWEIPKMRNELFTDHYGFVVDYLAEALRELRKHNFTEIIDRHFSLGSHLNARDRKAVRKTVSGLMKILYPHGEVDAATNCRNPRARARRPAPGQGAAQEDGLLRVLPHVVQLPAAGDRRGAVRRRPRAGRPRSDLGRPAGAGNRLHGGASAATAPSACTGSRSRCLNGTGKLKTAGGVGGATKESIAARLQLPAREKDRSRHRARARQRGLPRRGHRSADNRVEGEIGVAFFVAAFSALRKAPVSPALLVLGDMSIQGNIKPLRSLVEPLQVAMDNGAKRALIPSRTSATSSTCRATSSSTSTRFSTAIPDRGVQGAWLELAVVGDGRRTRLTGSSERSRSPLRRSRSPGGCAGSASADSLPLWMSSSTAKNR